MEPINWLDKGADWAFWLITSMGVGVVTWLNGKLNKLDERVHSQEKGRLEDKLENIKTFVDKDDLFKIESKIDKVADTIEELKDKLLTKP